MSDQEPFGVLHPWSSLEWDELPSLPLGVYGHTQMVCLKGTLYVGGGNVYHSIGDSSAKLFSIRPGVDSKWTVTVTPTSEYALVVHDSQLLLVGGMEYGPYPWQPPKITNKIFTMDNDGRFLETLPRMKNVCRGASAVSTGSALIVAGGGIRPGPLNSVEVFLNGQWKTTFPIPVEPYRSCSKMISAFNGEFWVLKLHETCTFRVSVESLISGTDQSPWERLPNTPSDCPAIAYMGGDLLCISGRANVVFAFSPQSNSWVKVPDSDLPHDMNVNDSCAISSPSGELMVNGKKKDDKELGRWRVFRAFNNVPLVDPDVRFSVPTLFRMDRYGINIIEELSKRPFHFYFVSGVHLPRNASSLPGDECVKLIFESWERSSAPTYPATWEGLFTVLRKMNLGHLAGEISKCVTGSVPEESPVIPEPRQALSIAGSVSSSGVTIETENTQSADGVQQLKGTIESLETVLEEVRGQLLKEKEKVQHLNKRIEGLEANLKETREKNNTLLVKNDKQDRVAPGPYTTGSSGLELSIKDLGKVYNETITAANVWFNLGLALGLNHPTLQGISDKFGDNDKCLREMLATRLNTNTPSPLTWALLCSGLRSPTVKHDALAQAIAKQKGLTRSLTEDHSSEDSSRPALTGEKRRQEEVTEHTEEEQVSPKRPRMDTPEDSSPQQ